MLQFLKRPLSAFGLICSFSIVLLLPKASTSVFTSAKIDTTPLSEDSCKGRDLAVFFAVKDYQHIRKLKNPIRDATKVAAALYDEYNFDTVIIRNPNGEVIKDWIENRLSSKHYQGYDQLLLFFSGHGYYHQVDSTGVGYFLPVDVEEENDRENTRYLSFLELNPNINAIKNKHILVIIDACYSGAFFKSRGGGKPAPPAQDRCVFIQRFLKKWSRQGISSVGLQLSPDGNDNSPLTKGLLNVLASKGGKDRVLTLHETMAALQKITPMPQDGYFGKNELGSSFLFVHKDPNYEEAGSTLTTFYIKDDRDFQTYKLFEFTNQGDTITWISDNINYGDIKSWQYKNKDWRGEKLGRLYRWEEAQTACPPGWKLPSVKDWELLAKKHGGFHDQLSTKKEKAIIGSPEKAYHLLTKTGFDFFEAKLAGARLTDGGFKNMNKKGAYWTNTPVEGDTTQAFAFTFLSKKKGKVVTLMKEAISKANAFSCRCVKE